MLTKEQRAQVMQVANAYDEEILQGIVIAMTDSGILSDMLTSEDVEHADNLNLDIYADDFDIMDEQHDWEFRQAYDELTDIGDIEEVCEHLATLI